MDFATIIKQLITAHEKECERRRMVEFELKEVRLELDHAQERLNQHEEPSSLPDEVYATAEQTQLQNKNELASTDVGDGISNNDIHSTSKQNGHVQPIRTTGHRASWVRNDVREFAMIKGWKHIQSFQKRGSAESNDTGAFIKRMISGKYSNRQKSEFQEGMIWLVEQHTFDLCSAVAIIVNSILIGAIGNYSAQNNTLSTNVPLPYVVAERIFTFVFAVELLLRVSAYRCEFLFGIHRAWHVFDLVVVGADLIQTILEAFFAGKGMDLSILRMLRIVRVARAVRVIKVFRFFKELRMMIYSILRCGTSLLWSLILFFAITYMFAIFLMSQVTDYLILDGKDHPRAIELKEYFPSVVETIYTLYACMSGGVSWKDVSDDLNDIHWTNGCALAFYVFFTLMVVSNILTGIFVDTAIQSASSDREEVIQEQMENQKSELMLLKATFEEADADKSGQITMKEFQEHLESRSVRAHFASIGIQVHEALGLFKLLDQDHSGEVSIEEFVMGCVRLKGGAKGIDLATLMYENKRLVERINDLELFCREHFYKLEEFTEALTPLGLKNGDLSEVSLVDVQLVARSPRVFMCGSRP
mmetsp:Transcript_83653/g.132224  ORF Transcript_83653/g.132224 Transcript_83653/m.132224 type:complete len:588 (-) Transcript_83653:86-1849(-)